MIEFAEPLQRYLAERPPGAWVRDLSFVTSGWESDVYAFQLVRPSGETMPLILRLFPGDGAEQKVAREANGLTWLRLAGYPAPAIFWFEPDP